MDGSHQVSSSGTSTNATSKLWERNKMLASLLAKQPPQPTTIPPIPASVISATPQVNIISLVNVSSFFVFVLEINKKKSNHQSTFLFNFFII